MSVYAFGCFTLNVAERSLLRRGRPVKVHRKAFDILTVLVENHDRVVTKDELIQTIWPNTIVEESNLTVAMSRIRTLLGDEKHRPKYILTLPRCGYRFTAEVRRLSEAHVNTIAVLPFNHDDSRDEASLFADALTESLICSFSNVPNLKVVPRSLVRTYKSKLVTPTKAATELGVGLLIIGHVTLHNEDVTISIELLRHSCKDLIWAKQYYFKSSNFLVAANEVVRKITDELEFQISSKTASGNRKDLADKNGAYELYVRGRYHWNKRSSPHLKKSIDYFKQAIKKSPSDALAYTGLADSYNMLGFYSMLSPAIAFPRAKAAAAKAVVIDSSMAEAHASLGFAIFLYDWDWIRSEEAFKKSIQLDPSSIPVLLYYGCFLAAASRFEESIHQYKRALTIDPLSLIANAALGYGYYFARRYHKAVAQCKAAIELDEHFEPAYVWLGWAYEQLGNFDEAIVAYKKALTLSLGQTWVRAALGTALARSGRKHEALQVLQQLETLSSETFVSPYQVACIYAALKDSDNALCCLEQAYHDRSHLLVNLRVDPKLDSLDSDPRFARLVTHVGPSKYLAQSDKVYRIYEEGRASWRQHTSASLEQAIPHFSRAIELDHQYVPAYAAIIDCYLRLSTNYFLPPRLVGVRSVAPNDRMKHESSCDRRKAWDASAVQRETKRAQELKYPMPGVREWQAAYDFARSVYIGNNGKSSEDFQEPSEKLQNPQQRGFELSAPPTTSSEELRIACIITRDLVEVGNIQAAYLMLSRWYTFGRWPCLRGMSLASSADFLLTSGLLAGHYAIRRRLPLGQKHAQALLNGAISLFEQLRLKARVAEARSELGRCYDREGMFDLARASFLSALDELTPEYPDLIGSALVRLAFSEMKMGHLHDALKRLDHASQIAAIAGSSTADFYHIAMATTLGEVAIAEGSRQHFEQACLYYEQARSNTEAVGHHRRSATLDTNYGHLMLEFGRAGEARSALMRARALFDHFSEACPQLDETIARLHLESNRMELAEKAIIQSVAKLQSTGEDAVLAESLRTQGQILCKLGRFREARRVLDRAYQIAEKCGDSEGAGLAVLITLEEVSSYLELDELSEMSTLLGRLLEKSQRTSVRERLRKRLELIAASN